MRCKAPGWHLPAHRPRMQAGGWAGVQASRQAGMGRAGACLTARACAPAGRAPAPFSQTSLCKASSRDCAAPASQRKVKVAPTDSGPQGRRQQKACHLATPSPHCIEAHWSATAATAAATASKAEEPSSEGPRPATARPADGAALSPALAPEAAPAAERRRQQAARSGEAPAGLGTERWSASHGQLLPSMSSEKAVRAALRQL
mmetsp:Transcript_75224/g.199786  ORF Transcript_75224/g.199786 Transcript_75224/m.199786 type:complete len:203 (-) Transcript_75224:891-1499(-)